MWAKIVGWVQLAYGDIQTMENNSYSRATTPEQIVAAAVVQSLKTDITKWSMCHYGYNNNYSKRMYKPFPLTKLKDLSHCFIEFQESCFYLLNEEKNLVVRFSIKSSATLGQCRVGKPNERGIVITDQMRDQILAEYSRIKGKLEAIEAQAAAALADMKRNEEAWNLAEHLLGMKRNEQGALVPIEAVIKPEDKSVDQILVEIEATNKKAKEDVSNNRPKQLPKGYARIRSR